MKNLLPLPLLLLLGCPPPSFKDVGDGTDTNDSTPAGDDSTVSCEADSLTYSVVLRDGGDQDVDDFVEGSQIKGVALVDNPCPQDIVVTTVTPCLAPAWTVTDQADSDSTWTVSPGCEESETDWTAPAGGQLEYEVDLSGLLEAEIGSALPAGSYDVDIQYDYGGNTASATFTVSADGG